MIATIKKIYTIDEYFTLENNSEIRYEFVHGKLVPIPMFRYGVIGESKNANKIANNILRKLWDAATVRKLEIFTHDVRLMVKKGRLYRYLDLVIAVLETIVKYNQLYSFIKNFLIPNFKIK